MIARIDLAPRPYVSAKFLLAAPPPDVVTIPPGFVVTKCPARLANGARRIRTSTIGGAQPTTVLCATKRR